MSEHKQLIEIAQHICISTNGICSYTLTPCDLNCSAGKAARRIYGANFRKIPEGAIILTREEIAALNEYQQTRGDSIEK